MTYNIVLQYVQWVLQGKVFVLVMSTASRLHAVCNDNDN